ncbi:alpha/beta hydrolase fold domain containing protein [Drepanopeziza brunnea f. sp. 'multigermtubi' MB_m1]|uniref:Alpha/beta hydrolase fold domain containing protein n=1 Tax=Marssonina brunnea f. sp. multigermtubi (strain MB_m1) TaxID=1072389 RepID=K1WKX9_MARBU|nr:alpha/beta hydrolase fold domain containing protein [Drepanopeziza brunnea f. sp. 'multigermtubi' MB_m1]EKD12922.1 alpha/beta hydrolase fold domain containing protein [Drepanopeziza brunnea f. sp. 'multigermtubi' MB_m1]
MHLRNQAQIVVFFSFIGKMKFPRRAGLLSNALLLLALQLTVALASVTSADFIKEHRIPEDLNGSNWPYPWPVKLFRFASQHEQMLEMAFMDVAPTGPANGKAALLLHGKNFCGPTWKATAVVLARAGYRVILPDQIGFCKSQKPDRYQFSLQQLASNTHRLLAKLGIPKATLIGHSLGGMLATRYSLMYPASVTELVLTNPIGLEDWKALGVPWIDLDTSWAMEKLSTYSNIRGYEQATYYVGTWKPSYDAWVKMLVNVYTGSKAAKFTYNQAQIVDMVLTQPIVYEFPRLQPKTLLLIGAKDNTAIGKQWSPKDVQAKLGHYDVLGPATAAAIPNATLVVFENLGHAPQIQEPDRFHAALLGWLCG